MFRVSKTLSRIPAVDAGSAGVDVPAAVSDAVIIASDVECWLDAAEAGGSFFVCCEPGSAAAFEHTLCYCER